MFKDIKNLKESEIWKEFGSPVLKMIFCLFLIMQLIVGIIEANDPKECKVNSVLDVIVVPMYALGCNLNKNRFEIKVN